VRCLTDGLAAAIGEHSSPMRPMGRLNGPLPPQARWVPLLTSSTGRANCAESMKKHRTSPLVSSCNGQNGSRELRAMSRASSRCCQQPGQARAELGS
jgi:hypothetical protein